MGFVIYDAWTLLGLVDFSLFIERCSGMGRIYGMDGFN